MSGVCRLRDGLAMPKSMTDEHELVKKIVILMAPFSWRRRTYATLPAAFVQAGGCIGPPACKSAGHQDDKRRCTASWFKRMAQPTGSDIT